MRFGLVIPLQNARAAADMAREAELAGWDGFFVGEAIWSVDPWIALTVAATQTERIRLGTLITPMPLLKPWKLASEVATLDHISGGRVTLGLGMGAVWMGWQAFPDHATDARTRAEMLEEGIDVLDILFRSAQEDYDGRHYHLKLSAMDTMHYPAPTVQKPRVPIWAIGVWPRQRSMQRVLKADGLIAHVMKPDGTLAAPEPADMAEMKAYVAAHRTRTTPFDFVAEGTTAGLDEGEARAKLLAWAEAGATWWIDSTWGLEPEPALAHVRKGPPRPA